MNNPKLVWYSIEYDQIFQWPYLDCCFYGLCMSEKMMSRFVLLGEL